MLSSRRRHLAVLIVATAALVLGTVSAPLTAAPPPAGRVAAPLVAPQQLGDEAIQPRSHLITLVTGDRLRYSVLPDGKWTVVHLNQPPAAEDDGLYLLEDGEGIFAIPAAAAPYLGTLLDPDLFNLTKLVEQGLSDAASRSIPLIVTQRPSAAGSPTPPGFDRSSKLESIDAVAGREAKAVAKQFGRALENQVERDDDANERGKPLGVAWTGPFAGIRSISLDEKVHVALEDSVPQIGAPEAWAAGFDGTGVDVAVLDSGIDTSHPDLAGQVAAEANFTTEATAADGNGHGTHVAATIAGTGLGSDGARKGVAPGVRLLNGKVLNSSAIGQESWIIAGMEWAAQNGADVINMSLGGPPTDGTDPMSDAVNQLTEEHGVLFTVAAGNTGSQGQTVGTPGAASQALTVGAVDDLDALADFSSRGPRRGDMAIKPDVTAPGVGIIAARATGTSRGTPVDDLYTSLNGTSMATPHVAGAAAILQQVHPDWSPVQLKAALISTATPGPYSVYEQGAGRIDVARAYSQSVYATPAPIDFGKFPFPQVAGDARTRTLTYHNDSPTDVTLTLSSDIKDDDGAVAAAGTVTVSAHSLVVPANGTATVDVTVDPSVAQPSLYGGLITAQSADASIVVRTPIGFHSEAEIYDVTIDAIARDGSDALAHSGRIAIKRVDAGGSFSEFVRLPLQGPITRRLEPGTYSVMALTNAPGKDGVNEVVHFGDPQLSIAADTNLTLDARLARQIEVVVPTGGDLNVWQLGSARTALQDDITQVMRFTGSIGEARLYATPTEEVTTGTFLNWTMQHIDSRHASYDLLLHEFGRIPSKLKYVVTGAELATIKTRFHSSIENQTIGVTRTGFPPGIGSAASADVPVEVPLVRTEYVSAPDIVWADSIIQGQFLQGSVDRPWASYLPSQSVDRTWLRQPARPRNAGSRGENPSTRAGNTMSIGFYEFVDAGGNFGSLDSGFGGTPIDTGSFRLYQDGALIGEEDSGFLFMSVAPGPSTFRAEMDVTRNAPWWKLSTKTQTAWTFSSDTTATSQPLPMLMVDYDIPLNLRNQAAAPTQGRPTTIELSANQPEPDGPPITGARLWVSFDDGASWTPQVLDRLRDGTFRAELRDADVPDTAEYASLKIDVWDAANNRVEQEITRAFAWAPGT
jgi:subtilisin family serine protease